MDILYKQPRAKQTRVRFLNSFEVLILKDGYSNVTITSIAAYSQQTKSSFLKHFGSKECALFELFEIYCADVKKSLNELRNNIGRQSCIHDLVRKICVKFEELLDKHKAANWGMLEIFSQDLSVDARTKRIFLMTVDVVKDLVTDIEPSLSIKDEDLFAACQLIVTLTYNYKMGAMPGFYQSRRLRHNYIADCVELILLSGMD